MDDADRALQREVVANLVGGVTPFLEQAFQSEGTVR
jgi:hypothetical protein